MPKANKTIRDFSNAYSLLSEVHQHALSSAMAKAHIVDMFAALPFGGGVPGSVAILMAASEDHAIDVTLLSMENIVNSMDDCDTIDFTGAMFLADYLQVGRAMYRDAGYTTTIGRIPRI